jgi:hypothetical protein
MSEETVSWFTHRVLPLTRKPFSTVAIQYAIVYRYDVNDIEQLSAYRTRDKKERQHNTTTPSYESSALYMQHLQYMTAVS